MKKIFRFGFMAFLAFAISLASCSTGSDDDGDSTPPAAVGALNGTVDDGSVTLTWTDPADSDFDHIEITWTGGTVLNVEKGEQTRTITGLSNNTPYTFTVTAVDSSGNKNSGESITLTPEIPLYDVSGLSGSMGKEKVTLTWTDPPSTNFDQIDISWTGGAGGSQTVGKGTQTCTINGLTNDTAYTFTVKAVDTASNLSGGRTISLTPSPLQAWTKVTTTRARTVYGIASNGSGTMVSIGTASIVGVSTDGGITWSYSTSSELGLGNSMSLNGITWGNGKFVGGGNYGVIIYSSDAGSSWTQVDATAIFGSARNAINGIAWGNNKFVAVGYNGKMAYSADAASWTAVGDSTFGTDQIRAIAWNGTKFVAVGYSGKMAYSTDGGNWTSVGDSKFGTNSIFGIAWNGAKFVAGGASGQIAYSADGTSWTAAGDSTFGTSLIYAIAGGNDKFVAVGAGGKMAYSADGISWTAVADSKCDSGTINCVAWSGTRFLAGAGAGGLIVYSETP